jgi:hypothetical protein
MALPPRLRRSDASAAGCWKVGVPGIRLSLTRAAVVRQFGQRLLRFADGRPVAGESGCGHGRGPHLGRGRRCPPRSRVLPAVSPRSRFGSRPICAVIRLRRTCLARGEWWDGEVPDTASVHCTPLTEIPLG